MQKKNSSQPNNLHKVLKTILNILKIVKILKDLFF